MNSTAALAPSSSVFRSPARLKLMWLSRLIRAITLVYVVWAFVRTFRWWTDGPAVIKAYGAYLVRDLSALASEQRMLALAVDTVELSLLTAAVVYGWKALGVLGREHAFTQIAAKFLAWCAWMAIACESWSLLMRPVKTTILTSHLPVAEQLATWSFNPKDLLVVLLCAVLVCFAYMMGWAAEVADENKEFI